MRHFWRDTTLAHVVCLLHPDSDVIRFTRYAIPAAASVCAAQPTNYPATATPQPLQQSLRHPLAP